MRVDARRATRLIALAAALGLLARLAFGLIYWVDKPLTHDEREYLSLALSLQNGRGFVYAEADQPGTGPRFGRAPGYPLFLAAIGAATGHAESTPPRVKVAQSILGGLIVWIIGLLAIRAGGPGPGVAAAGLAAVYPPFVWMPAYVLSETLYSLAALSTALALQAAVDRAVAHDIREAGPLALLAGGLAGSAVLIRPGMLFFLPLAAIWLIARRRRVLVVALLASAIAVIAPWTVRNLGEHGRLVLVSTTGGVNFWIGNHPLARGEGDMAANPDIKRAELEFRRAHPGLTADELEPLYYRDALDHIAQRPGWWLGLLARKAFHTILPFGPSHAVHSTRYRVASAASYLAVLPFAVAGGRRLWSSARRPAALFLLAASAMLSCLVFFPQERYRIPEIDPTLIVCAGALAGRVRP